MPEDGPFGETLIRAEDLRGIVEGSSGSKRGRRMREGKLSTRGSNSSRRAYQIEPATSALFRWQIVLLP
jgi:hypothetical protein